jgi:hypothetical protein
MALERIERYRGHVNVNKTSALMRERRASDTTLMRTVLLWMDESVEVTTSAGCGRLTWSLRTRMGYTSSGPWLMTLVNYGTCRIGGAT